MNAGVVEYVKCPERRASVPCSACGAGGRGGRAACRAGQLAEQRQGRLSGGLQKAAGRAPGCSGKASLTTTASRLSPCSSCSQKAAWLARPLASFWMQ